MSLYALSHVCGDLSHGDCHKSQMFAMELEADRLGMQLAVSSDAKHHAGLIAKPTTCEIMDVRLCIRCKIVCPRVLQPSLDLKRMPNRSTHYACPVG